MLRSRAGQCALPLEFNSTFAFSACRDREEAIQSGLSFDYIAACRTSSFTERFEAVVSRHPALRTRFCANSDGDWEQVIQVPSGADYYFHVTHASLHEERQEAIQDANGKINLEFGPLVASVLFMPTGGDTSHRLFITTRHLVVDLVSWRFILEDIEDHLRKGCISAHQSTNWPTWTSLQAQRLDSVQRPPDISLPVVNFSLWGLTECDNGYGDIVEKSFQLPLAETTELLQNVPDVLQTEPIDSLVTATIYGSTQAFPELIDLPTVYYEGHGGEAWDNSIDLSRTVGWCWELHKGRGIGYGL
ncbi:uncharacterized protein N7484_006711 [Penicillium longicatenatum]|uniref:uncharacterized protein n=1 Tax=Penicillium longicatenatum TaxID=1561947 RepID=UPI002547FDAC|nr:uncharacterized protein N7484_006711 [Penicillium longicatenatum]KAJ5644204.1 hypothetical protein N7484_006711 [Penicillium longicatenatum]